jgi:DNA repair exonuclease SbcCD ATPase subunit
MKEEQAYERLMRTLHEMQTQIEEGVTPVAEQVVQREVERLRSQSGQEKSILQECLAHIDQRILNCRAQIDEYRQTRSALVALNERLANLGAESVMVPDHFPAENLGDMILARLQGLRAKGKI